MSADSGFLSVYKEIACDFCEPDFAEYSRMTGLTRTDWLDDKRSMLFLEEYSFLNKPLPAEWDDLKNAVFKASFQTEDYRYPTTVFNEGFISSCKTGGCLFDKNGYEALQKSLVSLGEEYLYIEKVQEFYDPKPLRFCFPVQLSWKELISGGYFASFLCFYFHGFFFLFGPSAKWGVFVANDAEHDVEILGIRESAAHCFAPYFDYTIK